MRSWVKILVDAKNMGQFLSIWLCGTCLGPCPYADCEIFLPVVPTMFVGTFFELNFVVVFI